MRSPVTALLWETWRLTRVEVAFRMSLATLLGAAIIIFARALSLPDGEDLGATGALSLVAFLAFPFWLSIARLNGGRALDGGLPGFPFRLGYVRPVRTPLLVGIPLAYLAAAAAASYLVPAVALGAAFGYSFPLLPVAAWIAVLILVQAATTWWTCSRLVQIVGSMAATAACLTLAMNRVHGEEIPGNDFLPDRWAAQFALSLADYALIASIALAAVALTVVSVARQRRGDVLIGRPQGSVTHRFRAWLVDRFDWPCPTATSTRAQLWFELKSAGAPMLGIGAALALAIPVSIVIAGPFEPARPYILLFAMLSPLVVLFLGIINPFGLRSKQGRTYASSFDAGQPIGTARLASLKILARAACLLGAFAAIAVGVSVSVPLTNEWRQAAWSTHVHGALAATLDALAIHQRAALAIVAAAGLSAAVACAASIHVLWLLHPWRTVLGASGLLLYGIAFSLAAPAGTGGDGPEVVLIQAFPWVVAVAIPLAAAEAFRQVLTQRLLMIRHAVSAVILWAGFVVAWLTFLQGFGLPVAGTSPAFAAAMLSVTLLPLAAVALAPWSLSLVRHT